jgi:hypothetical protein
MLEVICIGSLALSVSICPTTSDNLNRLDTWSQSSSSQMELGLNHQLDQGYLAKGKPYESEYRREMDRESERLNSGDRDIYYRENTYHEDYDRDDSRYRTEDDADQRRRELGLPEADSRETEYHRREERTRDDRRDDPSESYIRIDIDGDDRR